MKLPKYRGIPFVLQFAWNPFMALDLIDDNDFPDHKKILPTLATGGIILLAAMGKPLSAVVAIAVLAASFGISVFKEFLQARHYAASVNEQISTAKTLVEQLASKHKQDKGA